MDDFHWGKFLANQLIAIAYVQQTEHLYYGHECDRLVCSLQRMDMMMMPWLLSQQTVEWEMSTLTIKCSHDNNDNDNDDDDDADNI